LKAGGGSEELAETVAADQALIVLIVRQEHPEHAVDEGNENAGHESRDECFEAAARDGETQLEGGGRHEHDGVDDEGKESEGDTAKRKGQELEDAAKRGVQERKHRDPDHELGSALEGRNVRFEIEVKGLSNQGSGIHRDRQQHPP